MKAAVPIAAALLAAPLSATLAQQRIDTPGTVDHRAARTGFPERVGEFRRANATRYDPDGRDISASYNLIRPEGRLLISVYVYPAPGAVAAPGSKETGEVARATLCARDFQAAEQAIVQHNQGARLIERGRAAALPGTEPQLSHRAVYEFRTRFDAGVQEVRSEARLYCHVGGDWQVKYRITAPVALDARAVIDAFVRAGPWPGRAPPPALDETVALPVAATAAP